MPNRQRTSLTIPDGKKKPCQTLAIARVNGRAELLNELCYLTGTVALPPLLLRTVMLCKRHCHAARRFLLWSILRRAGSAAVSPSAGRAW